MNITETHPQATALQIATEILGMTESEFRNSGQVCTVDRSGEIVLTNAAARRILVAFAKLSAQVPEPGGVVLNHADACEVRGFLALAYQVYAATGDKTTANEAAALEATVNKQIASNA